MLNKNETKYLFPPNCIINRQAVNDKKAIADIFFNFFTKERIKVANDNTVSPDDNFWD